MRIVAVVSSDHNDIWRTRDLLPYPRQMQDDPDTQDALKRDISSLAVMLLEEANTNSRHLHTLN